MRQPDVVRRLDQRDHTADIGDDLVLSDQVPGGLELSDDVLGGMPGELHGEVPGPALPDDDCHSNRTNFRGLHENSEAHRENLYRGLHMLKRQKETIYKLAPLDP